MEKTLQTNTHYICAPSTDNKPIGFYFICIGQVCNRSIWLSRVQLYCTFKEQQLQVVAENYCVVVTVY